MTLGGDKEECSLRRLPGTGHSEASPTHLCRSDTVRTNRSYQLVFIPALSAQTSPTHLCPSGTVRPNRSYPLVFIPTLFTPKLVLSIGVSYGTVHSKLVLSSRLSGLRYLCGQSLD